jgi:hypothetical protein
MGGLKLDDDLDHAVRGVGEEPRRVTSLLDPRRFLQRFPSTTSSGELPLTSEEKRSIVACVLTPSCEESFTDDGKESESDIPLLYTEKGEDLEYQLKSADVTPSKSRWQKYLDAIWMLVNVVSTVVIVFLNKMQVLSPPRNPDPIR